MIEEVLSGIIDKLEEISSRTSRLEQVEPVSILIRGTTGLPATGRTGQILINTIDNKAYLYADAGWREIATW
jgi:hypothetical protein